MMAVELEVTSIITGTDPQTLLAQRKQEAADARELRKQAAAQAAELRQQRDTEERARKAVNRAAAKAVREEWERAQQAEFAAARAQAASKIAKTVAGEDADAPADDTAPCDEAGDLSSSDEPDDHDASHAIPVEPEIVFDPRQQRFAYAPPTPPTRVAAPAFAQTAVPFPPLRDIARVQAWVRGTIGEDNLYLHPQALQAAKKSHLCAHMEELTFEALMLLGQEYRTMKMQGGKRLHEQFHEKAMTLGLTPALTKAELGGRFAKEYKIELGGRKVFLDMELKRGTVRQPEDILRIYYTWDKNTQRPVVGSLPHHLSNRLD